MDDSTTGTQLSEEGGGAAADEKKREEPGSEREQRLTDLPKDILLHSIAPYLSARENLQVRATNVRLRGIFSDDIIWKSRWQDLIIVKRQSTWKHKKKFGSCGNPKCLRWVTRHGNHKTPHFAFLPHFKKTVKMFRERNLKKLRRRFFEGCVLFRSMKEKGRRDMIPNILNCETYHRLGGAT